MEKETGDGRNCQAKRWRITRVGRRVESDRASNKLIATHQNDAAFQIGEVYAFAKKTDKAFAWLDRAYRQRDSGTPR